MNSDFMFPAVCLCDPLGTKIVLTEDTQQSASLNMRLVVRAGGSPEIILNRSTAVLLQKSLELWLEHLESVGTIPIDDDLEDDEE